MTKPGAATPLRSLSLTNPFVFTRLAETHVEIGVLIPMEVAKSLDEGNIVTLAESFTKELVELIQACQVERDKTALN